jgi:hypothetical protein
MVNWAGQVLHEVAEVMHLLAQSDSCCSYLGGSVSWDPSVSPTQLRPNLVPGGSTFSIRFATMSQEAGLSLAANRARLCEYA